MARGALMLLLAAAFACVATARPMSPIGSYKEMPVPCYMKSYNSFCFLQKDKEACTFYSSPSYPTYQACATSTNMGKTLKCNEVPEDDRKTAGYATCTDKDPAAAAAKPATWSVQANMDIKQKDIACNGKAFCEVCKPLDGVKAACVAQKGCAAFTWNGKCGYLKASSSKSDTGARQGWTVHVLTK